ncbi:hypothetical protein TNCV_1653021 [Trichonephila clavipes]|nr:hypothetical protein TNCV_1653021 [Trichonephila clavipes]
MPHFVAWRQWRNGEHSGSPLQNQVLVPQVGFYKGYSRAIGESSCNFEAWSNDEDDNRADILSSNFYTTPIGECLILTIFSLQRPSLRYKAQIRDTPQVRYLDH